MRERPILFNTEMVRAIFDGRKTCTRRVVKGYIPKNAEFGYTAFTPKGAISCRGIFETSYPGYGEKFFKLPYQSGDILYVRETRQKAGSVYDFDYVIDDTEKYYYAAGSEAPCFDFWVDPETGEHKDPMPWRRSIHMPKEAARIWLKVTDVKVERLQEIDIEGIRNEGLSSAAVHAGDTEIALKEWKILWDYNIKKSELDTYGWDANPYIWVVEFERCEKPGSEV